MGDCAWRRPCLSQSRDPIRRLSGPPRRGPAGPPRPGPRRAGAARPRDGRAGGRPARAESARAEGPACAVASPRLSILSGTPDAQPEAERSVFGRTDLCAADSEILTELGLPRPPVEAPRPRHAVSASFDYRSESVPASAPDGSPHRPPRLI
ncbi:hypothetical protein ACU4GR_06385 [Methylobacterium oryzae CBMB20]